MTSALAVSITSSVSVVLHRVSLSLEAPSANIQRPVRLEAALHIYMLIISAYRMASIIVSHFILNLRSVNQNAATASTVSFVQFQRSSDGRLPEYVASFSGPMHIGHSGVNDRDVGADITEVPTDCPPLSDVETGIGSAPEGPARQQDGSHSV